MCVYVRTDGTAKEKPREALAVRRDTHIYTLQVPFGVKADFRRTAIVKLEDENHPRVCIALRDNDAIYRGIPRLRPRRFRVYEIIQVVIEDCYLIGCRRGN